MQAKDFLAQFISKLSGQKSDYKKLWQTVAKKSAETHQQIIDAAPYSDIKVFDRLIKEIPENYEIHLANSTPVRYAQLFDYKQGYKFFSNRGTSGIDGCSSTAVGSCFASQKPTLLISGDLAFFYDSNAFWNPYVSPLLKIIVINNQGGGIFRFIDGPANTGLLETCFEARHQTTARHLAETYHLNYFVAESMSSLISVLPEFFAEQNKAALLEIQTPPEASSEQLLAYFRRIGSANNH
jgi:2-succinyl-5-enolpyruvyl-6-hydroxy-3-cyclohexene-1-carboxylate synthase